MLRIGEFAELSSITIHMLRNYDKIGLLCPKHVPKAAFQSRKALLQWLSTMESVRQQDCYPQKYNFLYQENINQRIPSPSFRFRNET